jgi:hypothetical protein
MNKNSNNGGYYFFIIILAIIGVLLFINIFLFLKKNVYESFADEEDKINLSNNINLGLNFQSGISDINATGSIIFSKPFLNTPNVFTQIIGNTSSLDNVYSVQVFNVTNRGFNYSKNKAFNNVQSSSNSSSTAYIIPKIDKASVESFMWLALG